MADDDTDNRAGATNVDVSIGGNPVDDGELIRVVIDLDLNQPDMAVITLKNAGNRHSNTHAQGDAVEIKVSTGQTSIFKGEVVGIEPIYEAGGDFKCVIRAFNRMHRLLRGRKSQTYQDSSDNDIVNKVAGANGLSAQCGSDVTIQYKHVYQHAQTDLEFLRLRAARIGYSVWVEDKTLHFEKPKTDQDSGIEFKLTADAGDGQHRMRRFAPRMSSAGVVKTVTVQGWDPEKKQAIVGTATAASSKLGATDAASASSTFGDATVFTVDHPIASVEEAKAIAQSKLDEYMMNYITGEAECFGSADYKPGIVVKITVNEQAADDAFNGKYFLTGVTHMYSHGGSAGSGSGGYTSILKVARDAQKGS